jgi:mono/diheme cytochrome c family protein
VLAIIVFVGFWVILGVALVFIAMSGGLRGARETLQTQTHGGRRLMSGAVAIVYLCFGVAIPVIFLTGNHARASNQVDGLKLTPAERHGRALFGERCGVCHTLAAANAIGKVGPNLDVLQPTKSLVLDAIVNGRRRGNGTMPALILQGQDARDVASFVARVAGK